ncbi:BTB domain-containing protein, partial [Favolaschia claudopus]
MDVDDDDAPPDLPEVWFEDGNIVIRAENTQFRVYRGVLAAKSPVFQDMFSIFQPIDSETVDGCPLIRLPDVATAEVAVFLKAIFDSAFFETYPSPSRIEHIIGILRLSHKYNVEYLKRRALTHLSAAFPTERTAFRAERGELWDTIPRNPPPYMSIIQLAREVEALWILPSAFYELVDACAEAQDLLECIREQVVYNGRTIQLSEEDKAALLEGYLAQLNAGPSEMMRFLHQNLDIIGCTNPLRCLKSRMRAIEIVRLDRSANVKGLRLDPLLLWDSDDDWERLDALCSRCILSLKLTHSEAQQAFWDQLPQMFGLPPWEALLVMKTNAM